MAVLSFHHFPMTPGVVSFSPGRDMSFDPRLLVFEFLCNIMLRKSQACWAWGCGKPEHDVCMCIGCCFFWGFAEGGSQAMMCWC